MPSADGRWTFPSQDGADSLCVGCSYPKVQLERGATYNQEELLFCQKFRIIFLMCENSNLLNCVATICQMYPKAQGLLKTNKQKNGRLLSG